MSLRQPELHHLCEGVMSANTLYLSKVTYIRRWSIPEGLMSWIKPSFKYIIFITSCLTKYGGPNGIVQIFHH